MTTSTLAFGKASAVKLHLQRKAAALAKSYATAASAPATKSSNGSAQPKPAAPTAQRELFMNVLNANATKRDAKQYLARFKAPKDKKPQPQSLSPLQEERNARHRRDQERLDSIGVNLGGLYAPARAIAASPQFTREEVDEKTADIVQQTVHVALVCLRSPRLLDDATLDGVALTLSQLVKLDMRIVVVLDCNTPSKVDFREARQRCTEQGDRLVHAIARHSHEGAQVINGALEELDPNAQNTDGELYPQISVSLPSLLLDPLKRAVVPIIPPIAYTTSGRLVRCNSSSIMSALSSTLSGLQVPENGPRDHPSKLQTSLDRIIILDSFGGIPSKARGDGAHVFINLDQEFGDIEAELSEYGEESIENNGKCQSGNVYHQHRSNLAMVRDCLAVLPSASSALIITPQEAASSSLSRTEKGSTIGTGTRRQKNTLIHNLLTNKPMVSSSLPPARMPSPQSTADSTTSPTTAGATLLKRGMPLAMIPAPAKGLGWQPPATGKTSLSLADDPRIDLPRLVHLIEDSFRRKLDVSDYLARIQNRTAGLIIAGAYEGGAILTWEQPPHTTDPSRLVPYLDKFAVLSSSQGSSGVADIVFQSMVRSCFPHGVCWRSRKDNPVNKWYFERSDGTWQIPGTNWTMFWTGGGVVESEERFADYVGVCRSVRPSWSDGWRPD